MTFKILGLTFLMGLFVAFALPATAHAKGGTNGGGGGNLHYPTADEVKEAVKNEYDHFLKEAIDGLAQHRSKITDPVLNRVFDKWFAPAGGAAKKLAVFVAISKSHFHFVDQYCLVADGNNHAASVDRFEIGSDVCYSLRTFTTVPKEKLQEVITAVAAHELVHQFGFMGEQEAFAVQDFILGSGASYIYDFGFWYSMDEEAKHFAHQVSELKNLLAAPASGVLTEKEAKSYCYIMGFATSTSAAIGDLIHSHGPTPLLNLTAWNAVEEKVTLNQKLFTSICWDGSDATYGSISELTSPFVQAASEFTSSVRSQPVSSPQGSETK